MLPSPHDEHTAAAWNVSRGVVAVVLCGYGLIDLLTVTQSGFGAALTALAAACLIALLWLQVGYFSRPGTRLASPLSWGLLGVQACLAYLPMLVFGQAWVGLPGFLAGSVLLVLPAGAAWTAFALVVASMGWVQSVLDHSGLDLAYTTLGVALYGIEVYLLTQLAATAAELQTARTELAQRAVSEERLRFARDMHDLLGLSLSAITLRGELAHRLLRPQPERAGAELAEVVRIARRALADVRSVASGYRELSLEQEFRSAESVLRSSDVLVTARIENRLLSPKHRAVIGAALREGVTNVLRHSKAEHTGIALWQDPSGVFLEIDNDGADRQPPTPARAAGSGLQDVADRVAEAGGVLTSAAEPGGRYRLHVRLPPAGEQPPATTPLRPDAPLFAAPQAALPMRALFAAVLCGLALSAAIHLLYSTDPAQAGYGCAYLAALLFLQLAYTSRRAALQRGRYRSLLLVTQAVLIYLPLLQLHQDWVSLPGFLGGTALLVLPPRGGLTVFAATVASVLAAHLVFTGAAMDVLFNGVSTAISGFVVFGVTYLAGLTDQLNVARTRLAGTAVADERLRFARDLHDLLGLSLSAITLKSELAGRLVHADPERAGEELLDVLGLARQALAEVRSVAGGYRELSLANECRSATSVLSAAGVAVHVAVDPEELPGHLHTALAIVLREAVTNVLRHSAAQHCWITARPGPDQVCLEIDNDGVHSGADEECDEPHGNGVRNLAERVARLGGELDTGTLPDGRFRLRATLPF